VSGERVQPIIKTKASSFLRLPPIQIIEREEDLGHLPPQRVFIAAEPVECIVRQISEEQEALGQVEAGVGCQ